MWCFVEFCSIFSFLYFFSFPGLLLCNSEIKYFHLHLILVFGLCVSDLSVFIVFEDYMQLALYYIHLALSDSV